MKNPKTKKSKKSKIRNSFAILAMARTSGGPMKPKKNKRKNGKNKQKEYLNEDY